MPKYLVMVARVYRDGCSLPRREGYRAWSSPAGEVMDTNAFDFLTKQFAVRYPTRRGLLRWGLGGSLGMLLFGQAAEEALACRKNGKPCARGDREERNASCCSGTCKRVGKRRRGRKPTWKCRPTKGAAGCMVNQDFCQNVDPDFIPCPKNPNGFCVLRDNGKPLCTKLLACVSCTSDADCIERPKGKCLKTCSPHCDQASGGRACAYPPAPA